MATKITVDEVTQNVTVTVSNERGPAGQVGPNSITSATTSDGTATLEVNWLQASGEIGAASLYGTTINGGSLAVDDGTFGSASVTGTLTADHIHGNLAGSVYLHIRAGEVLSKGDPVYVSGSHGTGSAMVPIVMRADASNPAKMPAIAIMDAAVSNNGSGHAVINGTISDLNTAAYSINSTLYVANGGGMTATKPANAQPVARVERSNANNGGIVVKVNGLYSDISPANIGITLSTTGGSNAVPKFDAQGDLTTGDWDNDNIIGNPGGNVLLPDKRMIRWMKRDGTPSQAFIFMWEDHDVDGGELIMGSPNRIALIPYGGMQFGPNDSARTPRVIYMVSGYAAASPSSLNRMPSGALMFQTQVWNGSSSISEHISMQSRALDNSGTNSVLQFYAESSINTSGNIHTAGRGEITGNLVAEIYKDGFWSKGTAPAFVTLTDGATITQACSKYRTFQVAKVTLGGNRTLAISGAEAGMRGVLYVSQDTTGSRTLALPSSSATPPSWSLSTAPGSIDRLSWEFDGQYYFWQITKGITLPIDSDAAAYIAATGATDTTAINNFIVGLKSMGLWSTSACWALRSTQNHGSGTTVRSFGGLGSFDGTMVGGPTWGANGIVFDGTDDRISILNPAKSTALAAYSMFSVFDSDQSINRAVFGGFNSASTGVTPQIFAGGSPIQGSGATNMFFTTSSDGTNTNATATIISAGNTGSAQTAALAADSSSVLSFANATLVPGLPARASYWNDPVNWFMGMRGNGSYYFLGSQAFHFFSTTRISEAQHTALRDLYKSTLGAGLSIP